MKTALLILLSFVAMTAASEALSRSTTVVLDPGHGGRDPGAVRGKTYEKTLNLDVAKRVETLLKKQGYRVRLTRRSDVFLSLGSRVRLANRYRNAIVVSIHFNAERRTSAHGVETYYCSARGKRLAGLIQSQLVRLTGARNRGVRFAKYAVLMGTNHTSVLVEGGFISNAAERRKLSSSDYRYRLALAISEGIRRY